MNVFKLLKQALNNALPERSIKHAPLELQNFPGLRKSKNLPRYLSKRYNNLKLLSESKLRAMKLRGTSGKCYRGNDQILTHKVI